MHWVTIKKWFSDDEVGLLVCHLYGGGETYILEKKSGTWSIKKHVRLWVT